MFNPGTLVFYRENDYTLVLSTQDRKEFWIFHGDCNHHMITIKFLNQQYMPQYLLIESAQYIHT